MSKPAKQQSLFALAVDESKLGPNQRAVLTRIDRFGDTGVREAGRIVYALRGMNPDHVEKEWLAREGMRVLVSLRKRGLVYCTRRPHNRWRRKTSKALTFGFESGNVEAKAA